MPRPGSQPTLILSALTLAALAAPLRAQGVTTAAVSGHVTEAQSGQAIEAAQVQIINRSTGVQAGGTTRANGSYFVQGLEVGGPYSIIVRRIGYRPDSVDDVRLQLGQNFVADFVLQPQAAQLATVTVTAQTSGTALIAPSRKGVDTYFSDSAIQHLPTLNRNFTDFVKATPQVSVTGPGNSAGGVNNRFNNIQIDGASENDLFGLGSTGQPGGQSNGKSISLEAVKEYQVLLSPYDVRQGLFNGALINAVTKSGTNEFHGSGYFYFRNSDLAQDVPFIRNSDLSVKEYGFSVGGPIIKDKLHFFLAPEWQTRAQPATGPFLGGTAAPLPVDSATILRFLNDVQNYGINAGSAGLVNTENPLTNMFGRIDLALPSLKSRLVARYNYGTANLDVFSRSQTVFGLSSNLYTIKNTKNAPVVQLFTNFANGSDNELILGYNSIRDRRNPAVIAPQISVTVPGTQLANVTLRAGGEQFSQGNQLDQDIGELTDNFTFPLGLSHRITVGTHDEYFKFRNLFTESSYGVWTFKTLDSLEAGNPTSYRVSADLGGGVVARFSGYQFGAYAEDNWTVSPKFNVTYGLRFDLPHFNNTPAYTPAVDTLLGRRTDVIPNNNVQWSPRVGFNWDVTGDQRNQLRGGIGLFVGRPVYVWIGNSWQNSGSGLGILNCGASASLPGYAPPFDPDPTNPPNYCIDRNDPNNHIGLANGVLGPVDLMSKDLKYPQVLRASLSYDHVLPGGEIVTLEALYTRGINNFFYVNRNLIEDSTFVGDRGRVMYGRLNPNTGVANPFVVTRRLSEAIDVLNQSSDYSYNLSAQLHKRFSNAFDARASYTFSHAYDVQSLTSSRAISNWQFGRDLATSQFDKRATVSIFDQPHKIQLSGEYTFPWSTWRTNLALIYTGQSGAPYDYIYTGSGGRGDLNADGVQNDLLYVPRNALDTTEIHFQTIAPTSSSPAILPQTQALAFENFIENTPCLRDHRGTFVTRDSCRNPWQNFFDMSVSQALPSITGRTLTLRLDIFNLLNLIDADWGRTRSAGAFNDVPLLTHAGMCSPPNSGSNGCATPTPTFQFNPAFQRFTISQDPNSYYQIQLSARVGF